MTTYDGIIHDGAPEGGATALKSRLINFRKWATKTANITVHGAICIVNGEATDGSRNAPVLVFESTQPDPRSGGKEGGASGGVGGSSGSNNTSTEIRCGAIDNEADRAMYDRSIGCQVRTVRDFKKDEVALSIPREAMITPDLVATSDAGQALLACCNIPVGEFENNNFWDAFGVTRNLEKIQAQKIQQNSGTQLLVKILQERKKVETALVKGEQIAMERGDMTYEEDPGSTTLTPLGMISYRAPFLAFLIHQRFANEKNPLVSSGGNHSIIPEGVPETFAPYARTLPSSICLPICWKRNELALLAGCIPGMPALQKVAARTMQLSTELIKLVEAGLLWRFPTVFAPGMITWDRWVWAAAVYESRVFPASSLPPWICSDGSVSPTHVWQNCGVLIPFLDMLNHENDTAQALWKKTNAEEDANTKRLNVITNEKTKKHNQVYRNYGALDNEHFMLQFGFTRMSNPADKVRIAWALVDGVGGVDPPTDYEPVSDSDGIPASQLVFESLDADAVKAWWTEQRIALLGKATSNNDETLELLKKGKKITFCAFNNGKIDPYLIAVAVVTTLPPDKVTELYNKSVSSTSSKPLDGLTLDKTCQNCVRMYLSFLFAKKLGKLLQSLNACLKDHFNSVQLWTKATKGGLNYIPAEDENIMSVDGGEKTSTIMGWQSFFDTYAWYSAMEVEERYYSMAPDSCVLTLYDGHVKSLQNSLDVMATDVIFHENVKQQLYDLGCTLDTTAPIPKSITVENKVVVTQSPASAMVPEKEDRDERITVKSSRDDIDKTAHDLKKDEQGNKANGEGGGGNNKSGGRNRRKSPTAIKLHIGNLSYKTLPNQLYDFFTKLYGKGSVLECHIPTERDTGNSRGFGFVTMPNQFANQALESTQKHEMDGRILKVAESNSAGSGGGGGGGGKGKQGGGGRNPPAQSDRCPNCGYSPRWCTCNPNMMPMNMGMGGPPPDTIYGPGPGYNMPPGPPMGPGPGPGHGHPHDMDDRRMGGGGGGDGWGGGSSTGGDRGGRERRRSRSRSPSYRRERERGYRRSRSYSRSRSRSYSRGRHRRDDRRRFDDRRRGSSRRYRSKSRSRSPVDGGNNLSPKGGRSLSRSRSPMDHNGKLSDKPRKEGRSGSGRSRSRDDRRRRKRSKGSRRGKEKGRRGGSRSRSR